MRAAAVVEGAPPRDWVSGLADEVVALAEQRAPGRPAIAASGLSPSGPIHLGNLREVMTPHLVADEIRRRGLECRHLLSWDDYDRFRRVPAGFDPAWEEHIGKPLTAVPPPAGSDAANWAEHFARPMLRALDELGIEVTPISQTERYTSGAYREQILLAMRERERIGAVLARFRSRVRRSSDAGHPAPAEEGQTSLGYFPYKPYCSVCLRDLTTVTGYDDATTELSYSCACGHSETVRLSEHRCGKLVWKVDWPMRWAYEGVTFEPSGVDHQSPGSSFEVGGVLVREIFGGEQPLGPMYAFVGISGMAKMSSSRGGVPTPSDALQIMESPVLRWLYARRRPQQSITVGFDQELHRLYDEWDALGGRVAGGDAPDGQLASYLRAVRTAEHELPSTPRPVSYRTLASIVDVTTGQPEQLLRILRELDPADPIESLDEVRPRLDCVRAWVASQLPPEQRTRLRDEPDVARLESLDADQRAALRLLVDGLDDHWSLEGLTTLVYAIPKLQAGLPADAAPTPELKAAQRSFFALLYTLLIDRDTGPRLPTLLLAAGAERVRRLLGAP